MFGCVRHFRSWPERAQPVSLNPSYSTTSSVTADRAILVIRVNFDYFQGWFRSCSSLLHSNHCCFGFREDRHDDLGIRARVVFRFAAHFAYKRYSSFYENLLFRVESNSLFLLRWHMVLKLDFNLLLQALVSSSNVLCRSNTEARCHKLLLDVNWLFISRAIKRIEHVLVD
jgi:hypothetical protein